MHAFRWRWRFSESIAETCQQAGYESGSQTLRECAKVLVELYEAYDKNNHAIVIQQLASLEAQNHLTQMARCEIYALRGDTYRLMGKYEQALTDFSQAIAFDENYTWAFALRGRTYRQMGRYEQALTDFDRAIALDEKSDWKIAGRGETYRLMGKYEQALADFDRAIALDEKYAWAFRHRGETYRQIGKYEQALADFDRAIALDEKYTWAFRHRGETYRQMGKYEQALADFDSAIALDEKNSFALTRRSAVYLAIGNTEAAQADLEKAFTFPLEDASDFYDRAIALILSNKHSEAFEMLKQAFQRDSADRISAQTDDLLDPIRSLPEFQELMKTTAPA
jgi:tetratricopeptide (TPR) repeat protein